jgi:hypothetical protein
MQNGNSLHSSATAFALNVVCNVRTKIKMTIKKSIDEKWLYKKN